MKTRSCATARTLTLLVPFAFCLFITFSPARAGGAAGESEFPYVIETELGATEFAPGDAIVINSLRGNRKHLEPGGRYILDGSYTLASADSADLAWFSTSRSPAGRAPITEEEHVPVTRGSGNFHLEKSLLDDGWLHVSFYVARHSHGGAYFGEKGVEKTVLRRKGWSDFANAASREKFQVNSAELEGSGSTPYAPANLAIIAYLGSPVAVPANLDSKYMPTNLMAAFTVMSRKSGWRIEKLAVDDSEFPYLVYGLLAGRHELVERDIREMTGYDYGGSVRGTTADGSTYFSLNMIPRNQYPKDQVVACNRRLMVRLQMLAERVGQSK